jgi:uncharacterized membrane protein
METKKTNSGRKASNVRELVQIGLFAAITFIATMALHIPYGNGGVIHLGDSVVFLVAILFGSRQAAISGAIGMSLFDLFSGYGVWAPYTFIIKAGMGFIVGFIAYSGKSQGNNMIKNVIGMILGGIWMIAGYYGAETIITGNWLSPMAGVFGNMMQFVGGAIIAMILIIALKKTKYFNQ